MEGPDGHFQNRISHSQLSCVSQSGGGIKIPPSLSVCLIWLPSSSVMTFFSCTAYVSSFDTHILSLRLQLSSLSPRCRMLSPSTFLFSPIYPYQSTLTRTPHELISYRSTSPILPFIHPSIHYLRDVAGIGLVDELCWELWSTTRCHPSSHGPSFSAVCVSCGSASVSVHIASFFLCVAAFSSFLPPLYFFIAVIFSFFSFPLVVLVYLTHSCSHRL